MYHILEFSEDKDAIKEHEKLFGGYNDTPPNFQQITEKEVAQSHFFMYDADKIEYRQARVKGFEDHGHMSLFLYFYWDGTGIGISRDFWKGKVFYFKFFLCDHSYQELSYQKCQNRGIIHHGRCWHVTECEKCGFIRSYDSSD